MLLLIKITKNILNNPTIITLFTRSAPFKEEHSINNIMPLKENLHFQEKVIDCNAISGDVYLNLELRRLDLLIYKQTLRSQEKGISNPLWQRGLAVTDDEIQELLNESGSQPWSDLPNGNPGEPYSSLIRSINDIESEINYVRESACKEGIHIPLLYLSEVFGLDRIEEQCLVICLAVEIDRKYEKLYAYLHDDITRRQPSVGLVADLLCEESKTGTLARKLFNPRNTLLKYHFIHLSDGEELNSGLLLSRSINIDPRIADYLLGIGRMDSRIEPGARISDQRMDPDLVTLPEVMQTRLIDFVRTHVRGNLHDDRNIILHFHGQQGTGKHAMASAICLDLRIPLLVVDMLKLTDGKLPFEEAVMIIGRELVLLPAALCLEKADLFFDNPGSGSQQDLLKELLRTFSPLTFVLGSSPWQQQGFWKDDLFLTIEFPLPSDMARKTLWERECANGIRYSKYIEFGMLASTFRFTPGQIREACKAAGNLACWRMPEHTMITQDDLMTACRAQSNSNLSMLAQKINPMFCWDDIVLTGDQMEQMRQVCNQARYRHIVYGDWGFDRKLSYGKGLNVLFSGPSGTGKTMAAEIVAKELGLDLYKIDLSLVVNKYIGETEKNLGRIFAEARTSNAILFFDEADAIFGKRSEVKDAHDRYANIEIGYLLQKLECHEGMVILASNLSKNIDEAFQRRMQFIIEFQFPDEEMREVVWRKIFPAGTPLHHIDFKYVSRKFKLSGGNIKNIALHAAFLAAADQNKIGMRHILQATRWEYQKMGCLIPPDSAAYGWEEGSP